VLFVIHALEASNIWVYVFCEWA